MRLWLGGRLKRTCTRNCKRDILGPPCMCALTVFCTWSRLALRLQKRIQGLFSKNKILFWWKILFFEKCTDRRSFYCYVDFCYFWYGRRQFFVKKIKFINSGPKELLDNMCLDSVYGGLDIYNAETKSTVKNCTIFCSDRKKNEGKTEITFEWCHEKLFQKHWTEDGWNSRYWKRKSLTNVPDPKMTMNQNYTWD